jgi:hypothetical protein
MAPCAERRTLSRRVVDAVVDVHRARNEYDLAKKKQPEGLNALAHSVDKAMAAERDAAHALYTHIKQHGCR